MLTIMHRRGATRCVQIGILVGSLSRRLCKVVGRGAVARFFLSPFESPHTRARGEFQSEFRGITVAHSLTLSLNSIYLPPLCQLALQHYPSAPKWLAAGRRTGQMAVTSCRPPARCPARGSSLCGECECRRTRHCSERGSELSQATERTTIGL